MGEIIKKRMKGASGYVILFGVFVIISLFLQCLIPFLQKMAEIKPEQWAWFLGIFNTQFHLPMEVISNFWAAISATYVGLDRAAFAIDAFKKGDETVAFDAQKMVHLNQVLKLSFVIYALAVILNTVFSAELALSPLFVSFGTSMLLYISGNKAISASEKLHVEEEEEETKTETSSS